MKNKGVIFGLIGVGVLYYINSRKTLIESINISPTGLETGGSVLNPTITIDMIANNPSSGSVTVHKVNANILYQGTLIGTINMTAPFVVQPLGSTPFKVPVNVSNLATVVAIYQIINNNSPLSFDIVGTALVDAFTLPLNITYTP